jgi:long-chain fatty acid transport protein
MVLALAMALSPVALATNGTALIGIGPIARSMGGVGVAAPQDAISAVFANPAAMCFGPYCPASEFNFGATLFMPSPEAKVQFGNAGFSAESDNKVYPIPAIGISTPLTDGPKPLRFGLSAYGVSGLGVDYRGTALDQPNPLDPSVPLTAGVFTELQQMVFGAAVAWQPTANFSIGLAPRVLYSNADFENGANSAFALGIQAGILWIPIDNLSLGLNYVFNGSSSFDNVLRNPFTGARADLDLQNPQEVGMGVAYTFSEKLLVELNAKWINWSSADGYEDFDWDDQWVIGIGAQFEVIPKLFLRAGYNYGENPVKEHNGWSPAPPSIDPTNVVNVQGTPFPTPAYEQFRIVGLPAIVEHHITAGVGYEFSERFSANLAFVHAFENDITERSAGNAIVLESQLSEWSLDFGLTWRF